MTISQIIVLLPCHSLEDFPTHLQGDDAASLLACWTAAWHPSFIHSSGQIPKWFRCDDPPEIVENALVFIPLVALDRIPNGLLKRLDGRSTIVAGPKTRSAALNASGLLESNIDNNVNSPISVGPADFFAVGYGFLQVQLMTRRLRYSSTLDMSQFELLIVNAANDLTKQDQESAATNLAAAFDLLLGERNKYYPVDAQLIDLTLLTESTADRRLVAQLGRGHKTNYLLTGDAAKQIAAEIPEISVKIAENIERGQTQVVAGPMSELPDNLMSTVSVLNQLRLGKAAIRDAFQAEPLVYGRRVGGLHPGLPQMLQGLGWRGAIHATFDDSRMPPAVRGSISWRGVGDESVDAVAEIPRDATQADSLLNLAVDIGEQIDSAHQATIVFAHWPDRYSEFFGDLLRICRFNSLLGRFMRFDDLFDTIYNPGYGDRFDYDDYRNGLLAKWVANGRPNPISNVSTYWLRFFKWNRLRILATMLACSGADIRNQDARLETLLGEIDASIGTVDPNLAKSTSGSAATIDHSLSEVEGQFCKLAVKAFGFQNPSMESPIGYLVLNPTCISRRSRAKTDELSQLPSDDTSFVIASDFANKSLVLDLPACGFAVIGGNHSQKNNRQPIPSRNKMIDDGTIKNEFFEVEVNPTTGGIRRVRKHQSRTNLLSQQLAVAIQPGTANDLEDNSSAYAGMFATQVEWDDSDLTRASVTSRGTLRQGVEEWARFRQTCTVIRGVRTIEFDVEIELLRPLSADPWTNYVCSRLAWGDDVLDRYRGMHETRQTIRLERFAAPTYVEIDNGVLPICLLPQGIPFHRQSSIRILDTLLIVAGEQSRRFQFSIAIGAGNPQNQATQSLSPALAIPIRDPARSSIHRFFHVEPKNILVLDSRPTWDDAGQCNGATLLLRETSNSAGQCKIHAPHDLKMVELVDLNGRTLQTIEFAQDAFTVEYHAFKLFGIRVSW